MEGYTNIDIRGVKLDKKADIRSLEWECGVVNEIRLHHVFEHFSRVVAVALMIRWVGWLKMQGTLIIEVPDFGASIKEWEDKPELEQWAILRHLTGDQSQKWGFHKELWTPERMSELFEMMGLSGMQLKRARWPHYPNLCNFTLSGDKRLNKSRKELFLAGKNFLRYSMVSDSEKATFNIWVEQMRGMVYDNEYPFGICPCNNTQKAVVPNSMPE